MADGKLCHSDHQINMVNGIVPAPYGRGMEDREKSDIHTQMPQKKRTEY